MWEGFEDMPFRISRIQNTTETMKGKIKKADKEKDILEKILTHSNIGHFSLQGKIACAIRCAQIS